MRKKESPTIPTGDAIERIRAMQPFFSKGHRKVARYILDNYEKAVFLTSFKMGQQSGVSESSVNRFATTLGYSGYSEMQRALQDILKKRLTTPQRFKETSPDGQENIMRSIMQRGIDSIQYAMDNLDENAFYRAVEYLAHADHVFLLGSRSSYGLVYFFGFVLNWIRDGVYSLNGSVDNSDCLATLTEQDLVLAISLPKYPRSTVKNLEIARRRGAHTIAITDTMTSPLIPYAEVPLLIYTELISYSDNVAPVMCLITALLSAVGVADQQKTVKRLEMLEQYWEEENLYTDD